jgi:hypothetical protein
MRPKTKDPSGGTAGRVKLYGRLGGWALAPNTASMGGITAPTYIVSRKGPPTFKRPCDFFSFFGNDFSAENYCAAARLASPAAGLSDAMVAAGCSKALVPGAFSRSGAFSAAGLSETVATGTAGAVATAVTAA